jgi:dihydroneopterin aldolase
MLGKYTMKGMHFHAFHGALEVERELGLLFIVDVTLFFPLSPEDASQSAAGKIKGADVYETAKDVMMGTKFKSRVSLALQIAREMLARFEKVNEVHLKITRKHFFIPGDVETIEAEVQCRREDFGGEL